MASMPPAAVSRTSPRARTTASTPARAGTRVPGWGAQMVPSYSPPFRPGPRRRQRAETSGGMTTASPTQPIAVGAVVPPRLPAVHLDSSISPAPHLTTAGAFSSTDKHLNAGHDAEQNFEQQH